MQRILLASIVIIFLVVSCKLKEEPTEPVDPDEDALTLVFPNGNDSLMVGANYDILWISTLQTTLVLEYSTDNGSTWKTISDSVSNTGSYNWGPVPDTRSSKCLMRVRTPNGSSSDQSDNNWSIIENINKVLILTGPLGGIVLQQGSSLDITWISSKITSLKIEFSSNNGNTWETVATNVDASRGKYTWEKIPAINSAQCLIRISDVSAPTISDVMPSSFTIVIDVNLMLLSPNGGEELEAGTDFEIKWYSKDIAAVKLEYSINNGLNWTTIVNNLTNTGLYFWNPIPSTPTTLAKIKITDVDNPANVDQSDTTFTILPEASITIISPSGGDKWQSGTTQNIVWNSKNVANVKIDYSTNNGATWTQMAASVPSNGSYAWNVPTHNSSLCNIRISDASDGRPVNIMEQPFTIYTGEDVLEVYSPNGGESWEIGSDQEIKWFAFGVTSLKIDYTTNNGQSWINIANSLPNTGTYHWKSIPNTPTSLAKVKISDASDGIPFDESNGTFTISQESQIEVIRPNGGEKFQSGTSTTIEWKSVNVADVSIDFTTNGGANWHAIVESVPSTGFYIWNNIPDLNSQQCRIKVSDAIDGIPSDISDNNFQISNQTQKSVRLVSPNGGEEWEAGTKQNITWVSTAVPKIKIDLSTDQGSTWSTIIEEVSGGSWEWSVNNDINSTQCLIQISDITDASISDISDDTFTISPIKLIQVTAPVGPITFMDNEPVTITWESSGIKSVGIRYTTTNGFGIFPDIPPFYTLVAKIPNQGTFTTSFSVPSDQYYVVVYNADEGANEFPSSRSLGNFSIVKSDMQQITLISPNGSEQWLASKAGASQNDLDNYHPYEIRWNSIGVEKVKIEWSTTGGGSWYTVPGADSTISDGIFVWAPGHNEYSARPDSSDNCLIRISSLSGGVSDRSDDFFSIHESKKIRLEYPNNGEDFYIDNEDPTPGEKWPMTIVWTSYAVKEVDIYYSLDNGVTWESLTTISFPNGYESTGAIGWDFVFGNLIGDKFGTRPGPIDARPSTLGRLKIVDHSDNRIWDINDIPFWLNVKKE